MTTIQPSLIPFTMNGVTSPSPASSDQLLLDQLTQQNQIAAGNTFGDAYSLDLSDAALGLFGGDNSSGNSTSDLLSSLTYSNYSPSASSGNSAIDALLGNPQDPSSGIDTSSTSFEEQALADGGPLPAFLKEVDAYLNPTQQVSLQNIANEFMDAPGDQQTVDSIAAALQKAGIPEDI